MICLTCEREIPAARLAAMPHAVQCVPCVEKNGDEPRVKGVMIWSAKHAPEIEIGTQLATQGNRRFGYGPGIRLDNDKAIVAREVGKELDAWEQRKKDQEKEDRQ